MAVNPVLGDAGRLSPEAAGGRLHDLFREHGRMVYGLCRVLLRDPHEAEDAAQQVFLSAHKSLMAGTHPREPAAWLAAIARNECGSRARERMREPLPYDDELEPSSETTEQIVVQREEVAALREAVLGLPDQQREAVVLREFYGLRYDEVGAALGVSGPAVESLLFRARRRLQAELRPLRLASGGIAVPAALRDALTEAVPGFAAGSAGVGGIGLAAFFSKTAALPLAAKVAAAALAVTAAGTTVGIVESESRSDVRIAAVSMRAVSGDQPASVLAGEPKVEEIVGADDLASPPPGSGGEARLDRSAGVDGTADTEEDEAEAEGSGPEVEGEDPEVEDTPEPAPVPAAPADEDDEPDEAADGGSSGPSGDSPESGEDPVDGDPEFASSSSGEGSSGHEEATSEELERSGESDSSGESGSSDSPDDAESVPGSSG